MNGSDLKIAVILSANPGQLVGQMGVARSAVDGLKEGVSAAGAEIRELGQATGAASGGIGEAARAARNLDAAVDGLGGSQRAAAQAATTLGQSEAGLAGDVGAAGAATRSLDAAVGQLAVAHDAAATAARNLGVTERGLGAQLSTAATGARTLDTAVDQLVGSQAAATNAARTLGASHGALEGQLGGAAAGARTLDAAIDALGTSQAAAAARARLLGAAQDVAGASAGQQRAAYTQLGFQIQDITQQLALGINPLVVLAQQGGQTASALAGLGGVVGDVTRFFAGPWGSIIIAATTVIGLLGFEMLKSSAAAKTLELASSSLADAQSVLGQVFDLQTGKIKSNTNAVILNARAKAYNLAVEGLKERSDAAKTLRDGGKLSFVEKNLNFSFLNPFNPSATEQAQRANARAGRVRGLVEDIGAGKLTPDQAFVKARGLDFSGLKVSKEDFLEALVKGAGAGDKLRQALDIEKSLNTGVLADRFRTPGSARPKPAPKGDDGRALANFGESAAEKVARIAERFDETPGIIDQATQATRELDKIIGDLGERKPPDFAATIASAEKAKVTVSEGLARQLGDQIGRINSRFVETPKLIDEAAKATGELNKLLVAIGDDVPGAAALRTLIDDAKTRIDESIDKPFRDAIAQSKEQLEVQALILAGREAEAEALTRIRAIEATRGPLAREQREEVLLTVLAEEEINRRLEQRQRLLAAYQAAAADVRGALEDLLSGGKVKDFFGNLKDTVKQLQGRALTEKLFGPALRELEEFASGRSSVKSSNEFLAKEAGRAGKASGELADVFGLAIDEIEYRIRKMRDPHAIFAKTEPPPNPNGDEIVVTGSRVFPGGKELSPIEFIDKMTNGLATSIATQLDATFGTTFFTRMAGVVGGALSGFLQAGPIGAVIGAAGASGAGKVLDKLFGLKDKQGNPVVGSGAAKLIEGAQTGGLVGKGATDLLGVRGSTTGGQIGGAIGQALGGPIGAIVGGILGSFTGGLLKKAKTGSATITNVSDDASLSGNNRAFKDAASGLAGNVQDIVGNIAEQLGGQLGDFAVSIGVRDGKFRVDPSGKGETRTKKGAIDFGKDGEQAAVLAAALVAIADGGVTGLSAAVSQALKSSTNLDRALREALKVNEIEQLLGGMGSELTRFFKDFERQAAERVRIAGKYGFDLVKIEEINAKERAKLLDDALSLRIGALQGLLDDLNFGDLFEGSIVDQRQALLVRIAKARSDAEAGAEGAGDTLAKLQRDLIDLTREGFGTAGPEFAADRNQAISSAEQIIALENARVKAAADAARGTNDKLDEGNKLTNETNDLLAEQTALLRQIAAGGGGGAAEFAPVSQFGFADTLRQVEL